MTDSKTRITQNAVVGVFLQSLFMIFFVERKRVSNDFTLLIVSDRCNTENVLKQWV